MLPLHNSIEPDQNSDIPTTIRRILWGVYWFLLVHVHRVEYEQIFPLKSFLGKYWFRVVGRGWFINFYSGTAKF